MTERAKNIVLIIVDQQRHLPVYASDTLREWMASNCPARQTLSSQSVSFQHHYISTSACMPGRATLLTGQLPKVHGVLQTSGLAKHTGDPSLRWLAPEGPPTLGHYLRSAGYETIYKGKWHLSDSDLRSSAGELLRPVRRDGSLDHETLQAYAEADPLGPYGFSGWVGSEPHGSHPLDSGTTRDGWIAADAASWLRAREASSDPFCLVVSFVNPHDICLWPAWSVLRRNRVRPLNAPLVGPSPTEAQIPEGESEVLAAYREAYYRAYGPIGFARPLYLSQAEAYRRYYHQLQARVDVHVGEVLAALSASAHDSSTAVIYTSDHGELLGSHGGLHQKWFSAFEEVTRVPMLLRLPGGEGGGTIVESHTSHLDILPTLLGIAGVESLKAQATLADTHRVEPLPGRDLTQYLSESPPTDTGAYFYSADRIIEGVHQVGAVQQVFPSLGQLFNFRYEAITHCATCVEAWVGFGRAPFEGRWKVIRVFDDPDQWSTPGVEHVDGGTGKSRTEPFPESWSLYNLEDDPAEAVDLAQEDAFVEVLAWAREQLDQARTRSLPGELSPLPPYEPGEPVGGGLIPPPDRSIEGVIRGLVKGLGLHPERKNEIAPDERGRR